MNKKAMTITLVTAIVLSSFVSVSLISDNSDADTVTVTGVWGDVTIDAPVKKIAIFGTAFAITTVELGFGDRIVMVDTYSLDIVSDYGFERGYSVTTDTDEIGQKLANGEGGFDKNCDVVVLYGYSYQKTQAEKIRDTYGIKVLALYPQSYDGAIDTVFTIGKLFGISEANNTAAKSMENAKTYYINELISKGIDTDSEKVPVAYVSYSSGNFSAGNDSSITAAMIRLAGGVNAASDSSKTGTSYPISAGDLELMGAKTIILDGNYPDSIAKFRSEMLVSENIKVYQLGKTMNTYASTISDGIKFIASAMYPEIFGELDPVDEGDNSNSMWYIVAIAAAIILLIAVVLVLRRSKTV
jgi:ABC-type Fe3+-hydroxamate transport system, periplasmic component